MLGFYTITKKNTKPVFLHNLYQTPDIQILRRTKIQLFKCKQFIESLPNSQQYRLSFILNRKTVIWPTVFLRDFPV